MPLEQCTRNHERIMLNLGHTGFISEKEPKYSHLNQPYILPLNRCGFLFIDKIFLPNFISDKTLQLFLLNKTSIFR